MKLPSCWGVQIDAPNGWHSAWLKMPISWDSKTMCFSHKDHCFTKDFQLTKPGDSFFTVLGFQGIVIHSHES